MRRHGVKRGEIATPEPDPFVPVPVIVQIARPLDRLTRRWTCPVVEAYVTRPKRAVSNCGGLYVKRGMTMTELLQTGAVAPDFELPAAGGGTIRLSDLRGRIVVLYFYPKDDTSGCTAEAIDFTRLKPQFEAAGATVIGMSPDPVKRHDKFRSKHELTIDLVADEDKANLQAWGVWVEKSMYGRKYMGVERTTALVGTDGRIAEIWRKVSVPGHAEAVLKAVQALAGR
jgi:peroxiredoxin Q/BCP